MSQTRSTFQYSPITIAQYDFLKELPLFKFYNKLKSFYTITKDGHPECKSLTSYNELQNICNKLGDILDNITEISKTVEVDHNINNNRSCQYLTYFIQEEIENLKSESSDLPSLYEALKEYNSSYENHKCKFELNIDADINIAKTRKQIYYYAEYLYWIKHKYNNIINSNETDYNKFFSDCAFYYNKLLQDVICRKKEKYQTELSNLKKVYDEALKAIKNKYPDINPMSMKDKASAKKSCPTGQKVNQDGKQEYQLFSGNSYFSKGPPPGHSIREISGDINLHGTPEGSQGSTIGKATPILCSTVAISMFSFILHKLLSDASQIPHNIAYQPVGN
ncbi:Plasmodium vivax Vir protein, putative [Plasmodium vivax]|nr:Plasmodium vivax Vir protein, putative [Plasmodium vivax]